jgi:hypothetical protein
VFGLLPASASCAPPSVRFVGGSGDGTILTASPGNQIRIAGEFWTEDCNDTGGGTSVWCVTISDDPPPERPATGLDVELVRGAEVVATLARNLRAAPDLTLSAGFAVPDVEPGRYGVLVHDRGFEGFPTLILKIR